jgi:hypothetical protein
MVSEKSGIPGLFEELLSSKNDCPIYYVQMLRRNVEVEGVAVLVRIRDMADQSLVLRHRLSRHGVSSVPSSKSWDKI